MLGIALMAAALSNAQNADNKWGFGAHLGVMEYNGDYANEFYTFKQGYAVVQALPGISAPRLTGWSIFSMMV